MSALAWIDFDQNDRDRMRRIMDDLFDKKDARDELGLGAIRDAFSDLMFPGTSTIQTRLRYMLFVPWIYKIVAENQNREPVDRARKLEIKLIESLRRGDENDGIIGKSAQGNLRRLPSEIYWGSLQKLGIRLKFGNQAAILALGNAEGIWSPGIPPSPADLMDKVSFRLTLHEADFLRDRLASSASESLFHELANERDKPESDVIWKHPRRAEWSSRNKAIVDQAEVFACVMFGAALLYNLMVSEKRAEMHKSKESLWHNRRDNYRLQLSKWQEDEAKHLASHWNLDKLWELTSYTSHRVTNGTKDFVKNWFEIVHETGVAVADDERARKLILQRECLLKRTKARLMNDRALCSWQGASGASMMNYRWVVAKRHLKDLADAKNY